MTSRILVVDDEIALADNIASLLKSRQFDAETAYNGSEALQAVRDRAAFDVVLLDVKMPGMDGIQVLQRLKAMVPELEVIMLTGQGTVEIGVEAIRAGAFDYLIKPCDIEDLTEKLRSAVDLKRIRRHPVLWPRTTVGEVTLYALHKLTVDEPLSRALEIFNSNRRKMAGETLFVTDSDGTLRGLVSQQALVDAARKMHPQRKITWDNLRSHPEWLPEQPISIIMAVQTAGTHPEMLLPEAAKMMIDYRMHSMPVVVGGVIAGIVRLRDVLGYLEPELEEEA